MRRHPDDLVVKFDAFTYTSNLENLEDVKVNPNYRFVHGDLQKTVDISKAFSEYNVKAEIHWAAKSHADRSIHDHADFIETNIKGILNLSRNRQLILER